MKLPLRLRIFDRKLPSRVVIGLGGAVPTTWGQGAGWEQDVSPAAWIGPRLHPFARDTGSVIPEGFEAYVRLFHPVRVDADRSERWADIARRNGRIVHSDMQFHLISTPRGETPTGQRPRYEPKTGSLPPEERRTLIEHLRDATDTPDRYWFCMWEGFGGFDDGGVPERVRLPGRSYVLYKGSIDRALQSPDPLLDQSPNLWWPDDRSWFVATEIDFAWTYVGGTDRLIGALLADGRLEAQPISLDAKADYAADRVNSALNAQPPD